MIRKTAVIFDMDGVIFDTERVALQVWKRVAAELGITGIEQVFLPCIGTTAVRTKEILCEHYGDAFSPEDFEKRTRKYFEEVRRVGLPVKPGAEELLSRLKKQNIPTALASSTDSTLVRQELDDAGLLGYFDVLIGGDMVKRSKPDPEIFLKAEAALHAEPADCIVIEDSFNGIRAAAAAGMHPLMVPDMLEPTEEIRNLAEWVFSDLHEVRAFFETLCFERKDTAEL